MSKKTARGSTSKSSGTTSSAAAPRQGQKVSKSSISKSSFCPSSFQLALLRPSSKVSSPNSYGSTRTSSGRLRSYHNALPGSRITCLDWGYYGSAEGERQNGENQRKRKRTADKSEAAVLAYGTSTSEICLFSISEGSVVAKLENGHERGVSDFKFAPYDYSEAWSVGGDGNLIQWDIPSQNAKRFVYGCVS